MNRILSAPRSSLLKPTAINTVLADVRQVRAGGKPVVSLMRGEPDFPTPAHISGAAVQALNAGRTTYPDNRGSAYGPGGEGTLRVSFASGGDTLAGGLERLREGLSRL